MARYSKFIAALAGAAAEAVTLGLLPDTAAKWVGVIIGLLTAAGVYAIPNQSTEEALPHD